MKRLISDVLIVLLAGGALAAGKISAAPPVSLPVSMPEVTLAIDGETLVMNVGQRFLLNLDGAYNWTIHMTDPGVLSQVPNGLNIIAAQGVFEAHKRGTTVLTAVSEPACRQAQVPCNAPVRKFRLWVVVR